MQEFTTRKSFERRSSVDGQRHTYIPPGTKLTVIEDDCFEGHYDIEADSPIHKNGLTVISVSQQELDSMR